MKNVLKGTNVICGNLKKWLMLDNSDFPSCIFFVNETLFRYVYPSARWSSYTISVKTVPWDKNKVTKDTQSNAGEDLKKPCKSNLFILPKYLLTA